MERRSLFILLMGCHLLGDYYLQNEETAEKKVTNWKYYIKHCLQYAIPFAVVTAAEYFFTGTFIWKWFLLCVLSHAGIDFAKRCYEMSLLKKKSATNDRKIKSYAVDQMAHFTCLAIAAYYCHFQIPNGAEKFVQMIPYGVYFLGLVKPANVTFKILFSHFQTKTKEKQSMLISESKSGAGAWIGNLERLLSGTLILLGQFSAVGLTMTAKSIARYDEIVRNSAFAEYYLIGTLYSILYTVLLYCIIFKVLV